MCSVSSRFVIGKAHHENDEAPAAKEPGKFPSGADVCLHLLKPETASQA